MVAAFVFCQTLRFMFLNPLPPPFPCSPSTSSLNEQTKHIAMGWERHQIATILNHLMFIFSFSFDSGSECLLVVKSQAPYLVSWTHAMLDDLGCALWCDLNQQQGWAESQRHHPHHGRQCQVCLKRWVCCLVRTSVSVPSSIHRVI